MTIRRQVRKKSISCQLAPAFHTKKLKWLLLRTNRLMSPIIYIAYDKAVHLLIA